MRASTSISSNTRLLIGGEPFLYQIEGQGNRPEEVIDIIKKQLFDQIQRLPCRYELEDKLIRLDAFPQEHTIGVREKGFLILRRLEEESLYRFAGTDGILHCVALSFYDPDNKKIAIAHLDIGINAGSLAKILNEFKDANLLEVSIFGGIIEKEWNYNEKDSKELAKSIYYFLYSAVTELDYKFSINIISADTFEKNNMHKYLPVKIKSPDEDDKTMTIGFVMDGNSGNYILIDEENPYAIFINNCGIFSGIYKTVGVCERMHSRLGYDNAELIKHYDNESGWVEKDSASQEEQSIAGFIEIFIQRLNGERLIPINPDSEMNKKLREYISKHLLEWLEVDNQKGHRCKQLLLDQVCFEVLTKKSLFIPRDFPYQQRTDLPMEKIVENGRLQNWCKRNIRKYVVKAICEKEKQAELYYLALGKFRGELHLIEELIVYDLLLQNAHYTSQVGTSNSDTQQDAPVEAPPLPAGTVEVIENSSSQATVAEDFLIEPAQEEQEIEIQKANLIVAIQTATLEELDDVVLGWKKDVVKLGVERLANFLWVRLGENYEPINQHYKTPETLTLIGEYLFYRFENYHLDNCDLDFFNEKNKHQYIAFETVAQKLKNAIAKQQPSSLGFKSIMLFCRPIDIRALDEVIRDTLDSYLASPDRKDKPSISCSTST